VFVQQLVEFLNQQQDLFGVLLLHDLLADCMRSFTSVVMRSLGEANLGPRENSDDAHKNKPSRPGLVVILTGKSCMGASRMTAMDGKRPRDNDLLNGKSDCAAGTCKWRLRRSL